MKVAAQRVRRHVEVLHLAAVLLLVVAAPTVGDIGSCGAEPSDLNPITFFKDKAKLDCARCRDCEITTKPCTQACDPNEAPTEFPEGCFPIKHDGEVCLHALEASSCEDYSTYMADQGATIPTECNFCPLEGAP